MCMIQLLKRVRQDAVLFSTISHSNRSLKRMPQPCEFCRGKDNLQIVNSFNQLNITLIRKESINIFSYALNNMLIKNEYQVISFQ